jgi:hypothetical protein
MRNRIETTKREVARPAAKGRLSLVSMDETAIPAAILANIINQSLSVNATNINHISFRKANISFIFFLLFFENKLISGQRQDKALWTPNH